MFRRGGSAAGRAKPVRAEKVSTPSASRAPKRLEVVIGALEALVLLEQGRRHDEVEPNSQQPTTVHACWDVGRSTTP